MEKRIPQGDPLVTIRCTVYNHEPFLRQCLDGFVMQETTFPFEAIVHDDASTDGSAAIIREYAEKYPHIIKPIYETENQYRKNTIGKIMDAAMHPMSKYIALCEGDDYWTDPLKLQKQVDFLETHLDYSLCSGNYMCYYQNEMKFGDKAVYDWLFVGDRKNNRIFDYSLDNYFDDWWARTLTCLYRRKNYSNEIREKGYKSVRDDIFYYQILKYGKGALLKDVLGVYRIHSGGVWSGNDKTDNKRKQIENAFQIYEIEGDHRALIKTRRCTKQLIELFRSSGQYCNIVKELKAYYNRVPFSEFCHLILSLMRDKLSNLYHHVFN